MKRLLRIRVLSSILIVCFTVSSVISRPGRTADLIVTMLGYVLSDNAGTPLKSDADLFDEEKAEEERSEDYNDDRAERQQTNLFFICVVTEPAPFAISESQHHFYSYAPRSVGNVTSIPRYLSQRTLLI